MNPLRCKFFLSQKRAKRITNLWSKKMKSNRPIMRSKEFFKKVSIHQMSIAICALILFGGGYCFSQSNKDVATVYLDKKDPKFISIKNRAISDLDTIVKFFDPESEKNKLFATWTDEMRNESQALGAESINDYAEQTHLDVGMFMMVITSLGEIDQKKMEKEWEVRVQFMDGNKYVAEFWEDALAVNSEENAVAYAHALANSEYAKKHPGSDVGNVEVIKNNYADTRKNIKDGKHERFQKKMALLYSIDNGGAVTFINPFQSSIDFLKKNSK